MADWSKAVTNVPGRYPVRVAASPGTADEFDLLPGVGLNLQFQHVRGVVYRVEDLEFGPKIEAPAAPVVAPSQSA